MLFEPHHSPERDTHFAVQQMEKLRWVPRAQNGERPPLAPEQVSCICPAPPGGQGCLRGSVCILRQRWDGLGETPDKVVENLGS